MRYGEGLFVGYAWYDERQIAPLFPFGHGLSYTTFEYQAMELSAERFRPGDWLDVHVTLTNSGPRRGQEVVQVYVRDPQARLRRPPKELKGFVKVSLEPGETRTVTVSLHPDAFAYYDDARDEWVVEPGAFEILAGRSAGDIRLQAACLCEA
ncbi:MAG: hypothetical protein Fur0018_27710 [Anaerolineales bacterium]